ncbi:MAG: hypothetical protein Q3Y08_06810 [Butyricicoccus sp.]|nr:hypothetical protein [Butyricicoccus sp.]
MQVGTVQTGDPGTQASVTNSGTNQNAILDFVIPQGQPGTSTTPDLLSTNDVAPQPSTQNQALSFRQNNVTSGTSITHQTGSGQVTIQKPGIYQAFFSGVVGVPDGTSLPTSIGVSLQQNGTDIPGGAVNEVFSNSGESSGLSFSVPFTVSTTPTTLQVVPTQSNFQFSDLALTVLRLGDATS